MPKNLTGILPLIIPSTPAAPIRPSIAFACLKSVPLHKDTALQQLDFLRPLFEWQSTIDYLQDPPQGYLSEGVDLIRGLDDISSKVKMTGRGGYGNEFGFLADLYTLTSVRPRDFHFSYSTLLMNLFTISMGAQFVAISEDGFVPPKVYLYGNSPKYKSVLNTANSCQDDVQHAQHRYTPSPVSTIDRVPALEFLQKASVNNGAAHDPDARFNSLFRSVARDANNAYVPPEPFFLGLSDTTAVELGNGTKLELSNTAFVRANFTNITSGVDLYDHFGQGKGTAAQAYSWTSYLMEARNYTNTWTGYPEARNATKTGNAVGFLLDDTDLSDVAVLSVNSFAAIFGPETNPTDFGEATEQFLNVTVDFLGTALASNRSKLILDVQGNGGGYLNTILALYTVLFPENARLPVLAQVRAHPALAYIGAQRWNRTQPPDTWPFRNLTKPDLTPWASFEEFFGSYPDPTGRGAYTHPAVINTTLSDASIPHSIPWTSPPFKPEDIVIVTDGLCGSACAIFVDMLVHAHGVRTVALGGRPLQAPMQAVGQTKGGPVISFATLPSVNRSEVPEGVELPPPPTGYKPPLRTSGVELVGWGYGISFNAANTLPLREAGEKGGVPLQFRYEAANCRLFYTWEMARDISAVWRAAADVAWRGGRCVPGSTTNADGTMGGVPGYTRAVEDQYRLGKGPGAVGK